MVNSKPKKNNPNPSVAKLYRSKTGALLGGVCVGLGEYFQVDPVIFRIFFILFTLFGGSGILIYFLLWVILPSEKSMGFSINEDIVKGNLDDIKNKAGSLKNDFKVNYSVANANTVTGLVLVLIGVLFILSNLGVVFIQDIFRFWPILIIVLGLAILSRKN